MMVLVGAGGACHRHSYVIHMAELAAGEFSPEEPPAPRQMRAIHGARSKILLQGREGQGLHISCAAAAESLKLLADSSAKVADFLQGEWHHHL